MVCEPLARLNTCSKCYCCISNTLNTHSGHEKIVEVLLKVGANVSTIGYAGKRAVHEAAGNSEIPFDFSPSLKS